MGDDYFEVVAHEGVHDGAVGPFDRHAPDAVAAKADAELAEASCGVGDDELVEDLTAMTDDAHRVVVGRPIDSAERSGCLVLHVTPHSW